MKDTYSVSLLEEELDRGTTPTDLESLVGRTFYKEREQGKDRGGQWKTVNSCPRSRHRGS